MSTKFVVKALIVLALIVGIIGGVPQKTWQWFEDTSIGTTLVSLFNGKENLSGLLTGPLDNASRANLTSNGIIDFTNKQRATQGLDPLQENALLRKAAENKLEDMFKQQYFEHESPDGKMPSDLAKDVGYEYVQVGENLALGNFKDDEVLVQAWMDSPGHRANILNKKYSEIGTAARKGMFEGKEVWLAVQEFGTPLSSCPSTSNGTKSLIDSNRSELATLQSDLQQKKKALDANQFPSPDEYNRAVSEYNQLANRINQLSNSTQDMVKQYNDSVDDFNKCLQSVQ